MVRHLKAKGRFDEAQQQLEGWLAEDPEDARLLFEMASLLDNMGKEDEAIPYYQKAIAHELDKAFLPEAYLGLGSSLRVVGAYYRARVTLEKASELFPKHEGIHVFLALALYSDGNPGDAMRELLGVVLRSSRGSSIEPYRRALTYYRDHLHDRGTSE